MAKGSFGIGHCLKCDPTVGVVLNGSEFTSVNPANRSRSSSRALCPKGMQCVAGCCNLCLLGNSCPAGTVAPNGYYNDNVCPEGYRCDTPDRRPKLCEVGMFCQTGGYAINCTQFAEEVRDPSTGLSFFDGSYCEAGSKTMGWCPAGYYCPTAEVMLVCPAGYWCPERTGNAPIKCQWGTLCEPGRDTDQISFWLQGGLACLLLIWFIGTLLIRPAGKGHSVAFKSPSSSPSLLSINGSSPSDLSQLLPTTNAADHMSFGTWLSPPPMAYGQPPLRHVSESVEVAFSNMSLTVPIDGTRVSILSSVTAVIPAHSVTAVMGGSGAGKTSLLNALCGRAFYGTVTGEVFLNGIPTRIEDHTDAMGFVPQDDILHPDLTVMENLLYSGLFQLPRGTPFSAVKALAQKTLVDLGLVSVSNSLVGNADNRVISGGQRKRVNIGVELMKQPLLLFLDEPTSGLDAAASFQICDVLARLAKEGVTIATVVHQPRYTIFALFDRVILLGFGGHTIYVGPPSGVVQYFSELGYQFPHGENPADFMLDISIGAVPTQSDFKPQTSHSLSEPESALMKHNRIMGLAAAWLEYSQVHCLSPKAPSGPKVPLRCVQRPTIFQQYCLFCRRLMTQRTRGVRIIALDTALVIAAAYIVMFVSGMLSPTERMSQQFEFCMLQCLLFSVLITLASLRPFADNKLIFYREAGAGYSISAFFLSQVTMDILEHGFQAFLVAVIHYELRGTRLPFISLFILYQLVAFFCSGWAYIFALRVPRGNVLVFSGIWTACFGTLCSGTLSFLTFRDIYQSFFLQILIGTLSSVRWFTEWIVVSENRTWPPQYAFTVDPFILDLYHLARNDRQSVLARSQDPWYYNVPCMIAVGLGLRLVAFFLIHMVARERMNKRPISAILKTWFRRLGRGQATPLRQSLPHCTRTLVTSLTF